MSKDLSWGRVSLTDKALLAKQLSLELRSGLTLTDALAVSVDSSQGKLQSILKNVLHAVESGQTFSGALGAYPKVFSGLFINTVYVGESSGTLADNLENIAKELEKERELSSKVKGAMVYPIAVLIITFILGLALSFLVLPKIVPLFQGLKVTLPFSTRALIYFSNLMDNYGWQIFTGLIALIIFLIWFLRQKFIYPVTHFLFVRLPIIGPATRALNLARFTRSLGSLLKSGQNAVESLTTSERSINNYYYKLAIKRAAARVSGGGRLSEALAEFPKLFPVMLTRMIRVSEESGKFEETLFYLSDFYELELNKTTKNLSTTIEPAMLLLIGLVVAGLALAIITPIYEITGNIKR